MDLSATLRAATATWLAHDPDPVTAAELTGLLAAAERGDASAITELTERFTGQLQFGTAGLRGVLGAGPQRMNQLLVRKVTAGLGAHLLAVVPDVRQRGVVVGRDARRGSERFAEETARVLCGLGIRVYLADREWSTPTTAWAVTHLGAAAGVMVTASHNPPEYNGYKVYWGNGAQIIPPVDTEIAAAIDKIRLDEPLSLPSLVEAAEQKLLLSVGQGLLQEYLDAVEALRASVAAPAPRDLVIAYTPLHGVGAASVEAALARAGFTNVSTEPSQREPDGEFPTVAFPNPEEKGAMDRVLALATKIRADLILANDPDADRLCAGVPTGEGTFRLLSGDELGALLADYLLSTGQPGRRMVATTIVSSQLLSYLAKQYGADYRETLTGFKWIANAALSFEQETGGQGRFVVGYEEAIGYSVGPLVRDKDGVSAAVIVAELAAWNRARGKSLLDHLDELAQRVGLFSTEQKSLTLPGQEGLTRIARAMAAFRAAPPTELAGHGVTEVVDLLQGKDGLPKSDVLVFRLDGGRRVIMRPSGTEPKLKSYYEVRTEVAPGEPLAAARRRGLAELAALRDAHQALLTTRSA
ncbi:MAG: phospho-sugar mutase [Myxococcales bacterium]|nr:phospho-sugar mutase [Myxococcales bacterium]